MPSINEVQQVLPAGIAISVELHHGGQRQVFKVDDNGREAVLKLMPASERTRAEREVAIGFGRVHPNLAEILQGEVTEVDVGGVPFVYFTEEFIEGTPANGLVGALDPCDVLVAIEDLAAAVEHLWSRDRVVHRDIKPLNMIRRQSGRFVLLDVGIGRHQNRSSITTPLGAPGTPGYYAPEQVQPTRRNSLDFRADLFLIGIVGFQLLLGDLPFEPTALDYPIALRGGVTSAILDRLPAAMRPIFVRLLAARPHQRYARFEQLRADLSTAAGDLGCI